MISVLFQTCTLNHFVSNHNNSYPCHNTLSPTVRIMSAGQHYENMSVQYEAISKIGKNDIFRCKNVTFFLFLLKT